MSEIIYGFNPVMEILKRRPSDIKKILLAEGKGQKSVQPLLDLALSKRVNQAQPQPQTARLTPA